MFLPVGDSPNLPKTPWMTWGLIAANVAVHLLLWPLAWERVDPLDPALREYLEVVVRERGVLPRDVSRGDLVRFEHGVRPASFSFVDAFSSMFLHAGLAHLLGNMLFLWIFGDNVEHRFGRWAFLLAFLGTGFAAALGDAVLRWGSGIPSVGASGAISGVLGLYFAWFPHNRVRVFLFLFPFFMDVIELRARWVLGFYLIANNVLPLLLTGGAGGVSYGAHIGGFVAGWGLAHLFGARPARVAARRRVPDAAADPERARAHLRAARVELALGSPTAAYQHLYAAMRANPGPAEAAEARALLRELERAVRSVPRGHPW